MSKLYEKYLRKKNDDNNKLYLFKADEMIIVSTKDGKYDSRA